MRKSGITLQIMMRRINTFENVGFGGAILMTSFDHVPVEEIRVNFMWDIVRAPTFKNSINFLVVQNVHLSHFLSDF